MTRSRRALVKKHRKRNYRPDKQAKRLRQAEKHRQQFQRRTVGILEATSVLVYEDRGQGMKPYPKSKQHPWKLLSY